MKDYKSKQSFLLLIGLACVAMLTSGCANMLKFKIADVDAKVNVTGNTAITVASLDKRAFIVDRSSPESYVGMVRGGYGNPFNATTLSNLSFADAVSKSICKALNQKGFKATSVSVKFDKTEQQAVNSLLQTKMNKNILVVIREWESDSFYNLNIGYDFLLKVFNRDGTVLATSEAKDAIQISCSIMTGCLGIDEKEVPAAFQKAMETLLNAPTVMRALSDK